MPNDFTRDREGFRFHFEGMKVNSRPDSLPPGKYPLAINIRGYGDDTIQSRMGLSLIISTGASANGSFFTDMRAYTALATDNAPRVLAYNGHVWLDGGGGDVGTLAAGNSLGASMLPFRPNASPTPWMYVANGGDYQKFSAPVANVVTQQKVGIAEPQTAPDAAPLIPFIAAYTEPGVFAGTATSAGATARITDTVTTVFAWPSPAVALYSIAVGTSPQYQKLQDIIINAVNEYWVVDTYQPIPAAINIQGIYYFTGSTGRCIVVPTNLAGAAGNAESSLYGQSLLAGLRRGAIVKIGTETVFVLSVATGPDGTISFETSTVGTHTSAETLAGIPAIAIYSITGPTTPVLGQAITSTTENFQVTTGIGTVSGTAASGAPFGTFGSAFQPDDYIHFSVRIDNLSNLIEMKILFDVGDGSFTQNFYYYTVRPADIVASVANSLTQLAAAQIVSQRAVIDEEQAVASGNQETTFSSAQTAPGSSQWTEIFFPISALTRVGNDESKTLINTNNVQFLFNASGTIQASLGGFFSLVIGRSQPDVGDVGAPYLYRVRPRSSLTGVVGNPSPAVRYGVNPRRQTVIVSLPSAAYDPQIDSWDIFRYGGSVTEWRFIGTTPSTNPTFTDNFDDAAATAGDALDFDNFEPWPSIDVPNNGTASIVNGTVAVVSTTNTNILRYLPGTLVRIGGQNVYTLQTRPTLISGTNYLLQFIENAGVAATVAYQIQEPILARQFLPYMWGPDAAGTVFACGDPLRAGTISLAKNYAPDSAPDKYNLEICPPSEPLLGGETIDGLSLVGSSERWWALYPQPQDVAQRYAVVQQPFTRGLAAPRGHCTDGQSLYWWAKDGIQSSTKGSLTDADLYTLFPHEGNSGESFVYNGVTVPAPDYSRAGTFRLACSNGYLYATYQDSTGFYHTLTLDIRRMAWCVDVFNGNIGATCVYHVEQPESTLQSSGTLYPMTVVATRNGTGINARPLAAVMQANINDVTAPIACTLAVNEFDGGDARAPKEWGDFFMDLLPSANAGVTVTPMSLGAPVTAATLIPTAVLRTRVPISTSFGGTAVSDFMGLLATWTDDFSVQSLPTKLFLWQPSFVVQPARAIAFFTFGTSFGISGYMHIRQVALAYVSTAPIVVAIVSYDGQSPIPVTLPSSGGNYVKTMFPVSANKGQIYRFNVFSPTGSPFQIFAEDSEIFVGEWGRATPYIVPHNFGGSIVQPSPI